MRTDGEVFNVLNTSSVKEPRFVVKIEYPVDSIYITSHSGIADVPGTVLQGALQEPSIVSQRLNPIEGRSEIGSASFSVVDVGAEFTTEIRERLNDDVGLRQRQVRFYLGYAGLSFNDFVMVGTQQVTQAAYDRGRYSISCADVQRSAKKDIFSLAETTLAQSLSATDTTVYVSSTSGFSTVYHGSSYSDAANSTVGYIKIRDEVIRYTGKTATTFTGCTRGVLGTIASKYDVDAATPAARREKVTEYVYLELPAVKLAYAILTGTLYGDNVTLPSTWHLGISSSLIRLADFTGIGADVWDGANGGVIIRFEGLKKTDGKKFLEEEICRLLGMFMPVYADGALGLKRAARVLSDAGTVATLDESNSIQVGELTHDMEDVHNVFRISWNWTGSDYSRTTSLIDGTSVSIHGRADPLDLKFKGLYGGRATDSLLFQLVDSLRDRYASPPERMSVTVVHSLNKLEVGDVVRVKYASVRDFSGTGSSIDRAFEIQNISVNHRTGQVQLELFGSTSPASALSPTTATTALPDAFYTATGTPLSSVATITAGVMAVGTYSLAGGADMTAAASIWYHNGDLTIPQGCTINISGNVQLRVKGYLTINGTINGTGGGLPGVADDTNPQTSTLGNPGYVGNSRGWDGIDAHAAYKSGNPKLLTLPVPVTQGKHASFPYLQLQVSGNALTGIPTDLRGTGGGPGGSIVSGNRVDFRAAGGTGAAGGAGLCTVSRGFSTGASATINLSGNSSVMPPMHNANPNKYYPGAGGAGGPGSMLLLLDGSAVSAPDLTNRFVANTGAVPIAQPYLGFLTFLDNEGLKRYDDNYDPWAGYADPAVISERSLAGSCLRIQFVPAPETATADQDSKPPAISSLTASAQDGFALIAWTLPNDPASYDSVELYASIANDRGTATKIFDGRASDFQHVTNDTSARYYWIRTRRARVRSDWYPNTTSSSVTIAAKPPTLVGYLTNEAVTVPADSAGTVSSFATAVGDFKVFVGTTDVTNVCTFSILGQTNVTASINASTGAYSVSAMSADTGSVAFRATYAGSYSIDKVFSVTKARQGNNGTNGINGTNGTNGTNGVDAVNIQLSKSSFQLNAYADGTVPDFSGADGTLKVYQGATDVTASATLSATAGSGVTGSINTATNSPVSGQPKGYYRITALSVDVGTLTLSAVYNGVTYTATFAVSKNKIGYEIVSSLPSTNLFVGRMAFLTTDSKLYRYTASGWTTAVPAVDISGQLQDAQVSALAASKITGQLSDAQIQAVAAAKVSGQLTNAQLQDIAATKITGQLTNAQLEAIASTKITGQLTNSQIESITAAKLTGQIVGTQITDGAISTAKIAAGAITANEIAADTITAANIAAGAVTASEISAGAVTTAKLAAGAVTANEIAANAITAGKISAGAIETAKIAAGAVTANEIGANAITAVKISAGAIETAKIAAGAVTADTIAANAVTAAKISAGAVETAKLAAGAVTAEKITASTITGDKIAANAITATNIAANAVTADKISAGSITAAKISVTDLSSITANIGTLTAGTIRNSADSFRVDVTNGRTITTTGSYMKVTGAPFGSSSQFIEWYGPYFASLSSCTEANATYYLKTNGSAYFGGTLSAGTLTNRGETSDLSATAQITVGPFGTNGDPKVVTVSYAYSGNWTQMQGSSTGTDSGSISATVKLYRKIGSGAETEVATLNVTGSWSYETDSEPYPGNLYARIWTQNMSGSASYTDNDASLSDRTYRAAITARSIQFSSGNNSQRVSIVSVEE
jgi:hypothetical protein